MNEQDEERVRKIAEREADFGVWLLFAGLMIMVVTLVIAMVGTGNYIKDLQRRVGHLEQSK